MCRRVFRRCSGILLNLNVQGARDIVWCRRTRHEWGCDTIQDTHFDDFSFSQLFTGAGSFHYGGAQCRHSEPAPGRFDRAACSHCTKMNWDCRDVVFIGNFRKSRRCRPRAGCSGAAHSSSKLARERKGSFEYGIYAAPDRTVGAPTSGTQKAQVNLAPFKLSAHLHDKQLGRIERVAPSQEQFSDGAGPSRSKDHWSWVWEGQGAVSENPCTRLSLLHPSFRGSGLCRRVPLRCAHHENWHISILHMCVVV